MSQIIDIHPCDFHELISNADLDEVTDIVKHADGTFTVGKMGAATEDQGAKRYRFSVFNDPQTQSGKKKWEELFNTR